VSNDNPFSEANFKTTKYRPDYPDRFENLAHARAWFAKFGERELECCCSGCGLSVAVVGR